jgi:hypothetical protein
MTAGDRWYRRHRYGVLFYTLIFTLVADPLFSAFGWGDGLVQFLLGASLLAAVSSIDLGVGRPVLFVVIVAAVAGRIGGAWVESFSLSAVSLAGWTLVGLIAAGGALRFAVTAREVRSEHLYAALSAYLLAGLFFGLAYWIAAQANPAAFTGAPLHSIADAIYFSFITLATLGYGDIAPRDEIARGLAIVEGVGGQLFLAVMVARLVSLYVRKG